MSEKFEREERYIVFKVKDLSEHKLGWVRDVIRLNGIPTVDAVVVEADWPEYEPTWAAIERRVTGSMQWDGQGLPPVGTVCELRNLSLGVPTEWSAAIIKFASRNVIVWDWDGEPAVNGLCASYICAVELRPIRTPEQIAAEERTKAIDELVKVTCINRGEAAKIYDAGYRKQVAP